jgi:hypothetical protein
MIMCEYIGFTIDVRLTIIYIVKLYELCMIKLQLDAAVSVLRGRSLHLAYSASRF